MTAVETHTRSAPQQSQVAGWTLQEFDLVDSTNFVAAALGDWHAVRADQQTAGRGRFQRSWISDAGGLWLSAVVPTIPQRDRWQVLPLIAGLAVIESLTKVGVENARLRWPNDIMIGDRKLAGLLVDSFVPQRAVVGIGVNVTNHPEMHDAALKDTIARLADLLPHPPSLTELTESILISLREVTERVASTGFAAVRPRINQLWGPPRQVVVDLDNGRHTGLFTGVDDQGRVLLQNETITALEPNQVKLLRELP